MLILIRLSGEVSTKAPRARARLSQWMEGNITEALSEAKIDFRIKREWSRFFVETSSPHALEVLQRVFGVQSFSLVDTVPFKTLEDVVEAGKGFCADSVKGKRFAVRAQIARGGQFVPFRSTDVERRLGRVLAPEAAKVDLSNPEVTVQVELRDYHAYFFTKRVLGPGGLPIGNEGKVGALASGGFDSAVAAWMMLKRGIPIDYIFCNLAGEAHKIEVLRVLKVLADQWSFGSRPQLHVLDFAPIVRELQAKTHPRYWQVILKRLMYRASEAIAQRFGYLGLVTGEALSQVSSQTLTNLAAISQAVTAPIFRPLIGFNKEEIMDEARAIGTYDFSATIKEHCALAPKNPATRASLQKVLAEEAKLDLTSLDSVVDNLETHDLRQVTIEAIATSPELEIERIPEEAVVLDLRSLSAYEIWHYPGAKHVDFLQALDEYRHFDKAKTYVLYCEIGIKSGQVAERMREAGFKAYNFKGGMKRLLKYAQERELVAPELLQPANLFE